MKQLMLGNAAVARGLYEAGCKVVSSYPGTPSTEITEEAVKEYVSSHMARHKVPKFVAIMESFPMTASGKIQKFKLREMAVDLLNLHDADEIETA